MKGKDSPFERDCMVFVPGIGSSERMDQTVEGLAHKLAFTLDMKAGDASAVFYSKAQANDQQIAEANINIWSEPTASDSDVPVPVNVPFTEGLDFSQLSWSDTMTLVGLRAHAMYWGLTTETEVNRFSQLVSEMYASDSLLS
jgi:hypothetical protein